MIYKIERIVTTYVNANSKNTALEMLEDDEYISQTEKIMSVTTSTVKDACICSD